MCAEKLGNTPQIRFRLPYLLGILMGHIADRLSRILKRSLPISSIRIEKFCANTTFSSAAHNQDGFVAPFTLDEGWLEQ